MTDHHSTYTAGLIRASSIAIAFAGIALLTTGCGAESVADSRSGDPQAAVDVCSLVATAKVEALLGDEVREPRARGALGIVLGTCTWRARTNGRTFAIWSVPMHKWDELTERDGVANIDDLGARAVRLEDGGVYVDPGNRHFFLQAFVIDTNGSVNPEMGVAGARLALD